MLEVADHELEFVYPLRRPTIMRIWQALHKKVKPVSAIFSHIEFNQTSHITIGISLDKPGIKIIS